jgi:hypothetical protein
MKLFNNIVQEHTGLLEPLESNVAMARENTGRRIPSILMSSNERSLCRKTKDLSFSLLEVHKKAGTRKDNDYENIQGLDG